MRTRFFARSDVQQQHKTYSISKSRVIVICSSVPISLGSSMALLLSSDGQQYLSLLSGYNICIDPLTVQVHGKRCTTLAQYGKAHAMLSLWVKVDTNRETNRKIHCGCSNPETRGRNGQLEIYEIYLAASGVTLCPVCKRKSSL